MHSIHLIGKNLIFFLFSFPLFLFGEKPTICLNMIVKNEAHVIERCLNSVKPIIDTWVIVDTGSTDGTQSVIRELMQEIPGELYESRWIDFAYNRNEALALAQEQKADYILIMDADDYLTYPDPSLFDNLSYDYYFFEINMGPVKFQRPQLIKASLPWLWEGVLHEYLKASTTYSSCVLQEVIYIDSKEGARSQDPDKFLKEIEALEEAVANNPENSRYIFYLAKGYFHAGLNDQAAEAFKKRIAFQDNHYEIYLSKYLLGIVYERQKKPFDTVVSAFLDAYKENPFNVQPLMRLAHYFIDKELFHLGYLIASYGDTIENQYPLNYTEQWLYDWGLKDAQITCAFHLEMYQECVRLCSLIRTIPNLPENIQSKAETLLDFSLLKLEEAE